MKVKVFYRMERWDVKSKPNLINVCLIVLCEKIQHNLLHVYN